MSWVFPFSASQKGVSIKLTLPYPQAQQKHLNMADSTLWLCLHESTLGASPGMGASECLSQGADRVHTCIKRPNLQEGGCAKHTDSHRPNSPSSRLCQLAVQSCLLLAFLLSALPLLCSHLLELPRQHLKGCERQRCRRSRPEKICGAAPVEALPALLCFDLRRQARFRMVSDVLLSLLYPSCEEAHSFLQSAGTCHLCITETSRWTRRLPK